MGNDIKDIGQAWNEFKAEMKKEQFIEKFLGFVFIMLMLNWLICSFIGWYLNPSLTQMQVLIHSLDFFEWNFKIK